MPRRSRRDELFGWLLRLFPSEFRGNFGEDMAADFRAQRADAGAIGRRSVARLWARTLIDIARRVPIEHLDVLRRARAVLSSAFYFCDLCVSAVLSV